TGLGLSQVHGFCVQAGGGARLASTPGIGTTVTMLLPASDGDARAPEAAPSPRHDALAGKRVLVVDDNEELADVTVALLGAHGCVVERARTPELALAKVAGGGRFDVVLSDIVMPGQIDGVALARELQRRVPGLPVVLISGYSSALEADHGFPMLPK